MKGPVATLFDLNQEVLELNRVQILINHGRYRHATNGFLQLELDRQQTMLDQQRKHIEATKRSIARMN